MNRLCEYIIHLYVEELNGKIDKLINEPFDAVSYYTSLTDIINIITTYINQYMSIFNKFIDVGILTIKLETPGLVFIKMLSISFDMSISLFTDLRFASLLLFCKSIGSLY